jgi:hypothetical protein
MGLAFLAAFMAAISLNASVVRPFYFVGILSCSTDTNIRGDQNFPSDSIGLATL